MHPTRVVVTGMGVVSPIGNSVEEVWRNACAGRSGITRTTFANGSEAVSRVVGEVKDFDPVAIFGPRDARRLDRVQQFALVAAEQALRDSGLQVNADNCYDVGCIIGTGVGGISTLLETLMGYLERGHRGVNPVAFPQIISDSIASRVSIQYGLRGPNYSVTSACATGNNSIGEAADLIRLGRTKAMLAGGSDAALVDMVVAGFRNMKAMTDWDGEPERASRPFDLHRSGFVASEGAAVLVLEEVNHALERGAPVYGEIIGYGHTSDAYHVTAPLEDAAGGARAIELALADAGVAPPDIDYVNAHGTGTFLNDRSETLALKKALGEYAYQVPISATKSVTGHMLGAAGAIEAIFSLLAIRDGLIPPTINLDTPDPDCDLDYTPNVRRQHTVNRVLSYSAGFGGHNVVLIFGRYTSA